MQEPQFQWKTPKNVKVVSGALRGSTSLPTDQETFFELTLVADSLQEGDQVYFFVFENNQGERHGISQQYQHSIQGVSKSQMRKTGSKPPRYFQ
jgi:hypothetical protein